MINRASLVTEEDHLSNSFLFGSERSPRCQDVCASVRPCDIMLPGTLEVGGAMPCRGLLFLAKTVEST